MTFDRVYTFDYILLLSLWNFLKLTDTIKNSLSYKSLVVDFWYLVYSLRYSLEKSKILKTGAKTLKY